MCQERPVKATCGITRVFFGSDFITVTKSEEIAWDLLKPQIFAAIMDFYSSGQPLILDSTTAASMDTAIHEDDSETVAMIKEPWRLGACSGCPSSSVTLKSGIENMLMHYVPEVKGVEQELDDEHEDAALTGAPHE
ncbi:NifU-like protein 4, mitochondrial [Sesamum angolense]|uniref:NifU-like protein 4, mitochondrial n=1 Tax=Sesamum angolense TaxID=2727404 RepID=A0AAE1W2G5_9LAMI|nr:NifU-like protein 4, mitochondrial [Sesamum angolense]